MSERNKTSVGQLISAWRAKALGAEIGNTRMARAQLRRADGPVAALAVKAVHELNRDLLAAGHDMRSGDRPERLALIAVALAHVKEGTGLRAAQAFGAGDPPRLSAIRFNALIRAKNPRDLWKPLVRGLGVIDGRADAAHLAQDILYWNDKTRTRWCFEYYGASQAAPTPEQPTEEATE